VSLREVVRQHLIGPGTYPWADRVYELRSALASQVPPSTVMPWVGIGIGTETPGMWGDKGTQVDIWPHAEPSTWQVSDALVTTIGELTGVATYGRLLQDLDGTAYLLEYVGKPLGDTPVESWESYAVPLRYTAAPVRWLPATTDGPDPVVHLRTWLEAAYPALQTDPLVWAPSDANPAVYVRYTSMPYVRDDATDRMFYCTWYTCTLALHVVAPSVQVRTLWQRRLGERLAQQSIPYDGVFMQANVTNSDPTASPVSEGQLRVEVRYPDRAAYLATQGPPLTKVYLDDNGQVITSVAR
jgi:hypothetical protein